MLYINPCERTVTYDTMLQMKSLGSSVGLASVEHVAGIVVEVNPVLHTLSFAQSVEFIDALVQSVSTSQFAKAVLWLHL